MAGESGRKVTLREVAELADVSLATVYRVARGATHVTPEIHERVTTAAASLGVDLSRSSKFRVIAFLLCNRELHQRFDFNSHILLGADSYCAAREWSMLFHRLVYPREVCPQDLHLPTILQRRDIISGIIVSGMIFPNLLERLHDSGMPYCVMGNNVSGEWRPSEHNVIWFDDISGSLEMTSFLQSLGHRNIWFVGNCNFPWHARRYKGYERGMLDAGLTPRLSTSHADADSDIGYLATKSILAKSEPVSAILAGSDAIAEGVYRALRDFRLRIPEDVSVAGFNDTEARLLHPPLTTIRVFSDEIGKQMAELVLRHAAGPGLPPEHFTVPTELVKRQSCQLFSGVEVKLQAAK
jgi:DNA-binding LacI/PurR family transcriptional regulator